MSCCYRKKYIRGKGQRRFGFKKGIKTQSSSIPKRLLDKRRTLLKASIMKTEDG